MDSFQMLLAQGQEKSICSVCCLTPVFEVVLERKLHFKTVCKLQVSHFYYFFGQSPSYHYLPKFSPYLC